MALTPSGSQIDNPSGGSGGGVTSVNTLTGAVVLTPAIIGAVPRPNTRRWAYFCADGSAGLPANKGIGDILSSQTSNGVTTGGNPASTVQPAYIEVTTGAATSADAKFASTNPVYLSGRNLRFEGYFQIQTTYAAVRFWAGFTNNNLYGSDTNTSVKFYAFRASTNVPDTNYQCITCDGSAETITDSGVAVTAGWHEFEIVVNDSIPNASFYIDGTLVATNTTHIITAGIPLYWGAFIDLPTGAATKSLWMGWGYAESDL